MIHVVIQYGKFYGRYKSFHLTLKIRIIELKSHSLQLLLSKTFLQLLKVYLLLQSASFFQLSQLPFETTLASLVMVLVSHQFSLLLPLHQILYIHRLLMQLLLYCISKKATIFLIREKIPGKKVNIDQNRNRKR